MTRRARRTTGAALATMVLLAGCAQDPAETATAPDTPAAGNDLEAFCAGYLEQFRAMSELDPEDAEGRLRSIQTWLERVEATGLPSDLPATAREGFLTFNRLVGDLDPETATLESISQEPTPAQEQKLDAFGDWLEASCPELQEELDEALDRALDEQDGSERPSN